MIDSDDYFSVMLNNVWNLTGGANPMLTYVESDPNAKQANNIYKYMGEQKPS